jgi:uncharacterized protein (DUF433 family)
MAGGGLAGVAFSSLRFCGEMTGSRQEPNERAYVMNPFQSRITIDPNICHGQPCVRGLRYPVEFLLDLLSSGMTFDEILGDYPDLERDDLRAVLAFAARLARSKRVDPVAP